MPHCPYSDCRVLETFFRNRPIGTLHALAKMLRCPGAQTADGLSKLADGAGSLYRIAGRKRKSDGSVRIFFDAKFPLKTVHGRIQAMILKTVEFPAYLQGGIKKRGQGSNASWHVG